MAEDIYYLAQKDRDLLNRLHKRQVSDPINERIQHHQPEEWEEYSDSSSNHYVCKPPEGFDIPARDGVFPGAMQCFIAKLVPSTGDLSEPFRNYEFLSNPDGSGVFNWVYNMHDCPAPWQQFHNISRDRSGHWMVHRPSACPPCCVKFYNATSEAVPPYAIMKVESIAEDPYGGDIYTITKMDELEGSMPPMFLINRGDFVSAASYGYACVPEQGKPLRVYCDVNNITVGQHFGPLYGLWYGTPASYGFQMVGKADASTFTAYAIYRDVGATAYWSQSGSESLTTDDTHIDCVTAGGQHQGGQWVYFFDPDSGTSAIDVLPCGDYLVWFEFGLTFSETTVTLDLEQVTPTGFGPDEVDWSLSHTTLRSWTFSAPDTGDDESLTRYFTVAPVHFKCKGIENEDTGQLFASRGVRYKARRSSVGSATLFDGRIILQKIAGP